MLIWARSPSLPLLTHFCPLLKWWSLQHPQRAPGWRVYEAVKRGTWKEPEFTNTVREQQLSFRVLKDHVTNILVYQRFHCFCLSSLFICILAWFSCICILSQYIFVMHLNSILENKLVSGCVQSPRGDRLVYYTVRTFTGSGLTCYGTYRSERCNSILLCFIHACLKWSKWKLNILWNVCQES